MLLAITAVRTVHLLRDPEIAKRVPEHVKSTVARLFGTGAATFAFGFFIWNLDNVFCETITRWKHAVGWPAAFVLEGACHQSVTGPSLIFVHRPFLVAHPHGEPDAVSTPPACSITRNRT